MGVNVSMALPVTDEITRSTLRSLRNSITGTPTPTGSGVGIGVADGKVGCCDGRIGVDAGVAGAQAVRIMLRARPTIKIRLSFKMVTLHS